VIKGNSVGKENESINQTKIQQKNIKKQNIIMQGEIKRATVS